MSTLSAPVEEKQGSAVALPRPAQSLSIVLVAYALGNLTAYVRDATIADHFGAGALSDAYFVSAFLPTLLATLLVYESLVPVILPAFARLSMSPAAERMLARRLAIVSGVVLTAIALLLILAAPVVVHLAAAGWSKPEAATGAMLLRITGGSLVPLGIGALIASLANAHRRFLAPPLGLAASNLAVILATVSLSHQLGIFAPAWGLLYGSMMYLAIQLIALRGAWSRRLHRFPLRVGLHSELRATNASPTHGDAISSILPALLPMLVFATLAQCVPVVERWLSSGLPAGQLSYLTYAGKLMMSPILVITAATNLLSFVGLSHGDRSDPASLRRELGRGARTTSGLLLVAALALILVRRPLVSLALQHGDFNAHDAGTTSTLLAIYALGLIPNGLSWLLYRSCQAGGEYRKATVVMALQAAIYVALSLFLFSRWRLVGLPIAFAVGQTVQLALLAGVHSSLLRPAARSIGRYALGLAVVALVAVAAESLVGPVLSSLARRGAVGTVESLLAGMVVLALSCGGCAILLGATNVRSWTKRARSI